MDEKKYQIDKVPASAKDIIEKARELDKDFDGCDFYQTSVAAQILRREGYSVGDLQV